MRQAREKERPRNEKKIMTADGREVGTYYNNIIHTPDSRAIAKRLSVVLYYRYHCYHCYYYYYYCRRQPPRARDPSKNILLYAQL